MFQWCCIAFCSFPVGNVVSWYTRIVTKLSFAIDLLFDVVDVGLYLLIWFLFPVDDVKSGIVISFERAGCGAGLNLGLTVAYVLYAYLYCIGSL